jgi:branched-chain amino acid transport system permease protein
MRLPHAAPRLRGALIAGAAIAVVAFPAASGNAYYLQIGTDIAIAAILALGLGLLYGYAGQISFAQGAFYGVGAYTSVLLVSRLDVPWLLGVLAGMAMPALAALLVGIPTLRLRGHYLAIATLALQIAFSEFFVHASGLTGGPVGLFEIERPGFVAGDDSYYLLVVAAALVTLLLAHRLAHSRFGRALTFIREDEEAAATLGVNPAREKLIVFAICAALAGLAGALYAYKIQFISPVTFSLNQSILVLSMVVIGGLGSNYGAVAGAIAVTVITQVLFSVGNLSFLIYGAWIVAVMVLFPRGLAGVGQLARDAAARAMRARRRPAPERPLSPDAG